MGIDDRRDHSIRIPRPDHSVEFGTPNACNQCHTDKDAKWAANAVVDFKGPDRPKDVRHPEAFHAFRKVSLRPKVYFWKLVVIRNPRFHQGRCDACTASVYQ